MELSYFCLLIICLGVATESVEKKNSGKFYLKAPQISSGSRYFAPMVLNYWPKIFQHIFLNSVGEMCTSPSVSNVTNEYENIETEYKARSISFGKKLNSLRKNDLEKKVKNHQIRERILKSLPLDLQTKVRNIANQLKLEALKNEASLERQKLKTQLELKKKTKI